MLRRLHIRDFVIVQSLDLEWSAGFTALTGETGAGKSILIDALQLVLGQRADSTVVREGAQRAEVTVEFDLPPALQGWMDEHGFDRNEGLLVLRRQVDAAGKSRGWINGHVATAAQLRAVADHVLDIHGQHAWQGLTRAASVRGLLDAYANADTGAVRAAWQAWREAHQRYTQAAEQAEAIARQREGLVWQLAELQRLAPQAGEWESLDAEHRRLAHGQALMDGCHTAEERLQGGDGSALERVDAVLHQLDELQRHEPELQGIAQGLRDARALIDDAAHSIRQLRKRLDLDPRRLQQLEDRLSAWMGLARRLRRPPAELPHLLQQWQVELQGLEAALDTDALQAATEQALAGYRKAAAALSQVRIQAAQGLAQAVTAAMQQLGMVGGAFEVALLPEAEPQAWGAETAEFRVAGHEGSTPRALAKVASGGELSRLALAIAVTTARADPLGAGTLIFDEIDSGVGGTVADTVGRLMRQLGRERQVLSVTHLAQVASCADHHWVVRKQAQGGHTLSGVKPVEGEARVAELARMLGGERLATSVAHAHTLLEEGRT